MTKYVKFRRKFLASGLTQKAFAKQEGIAASTTHYYLKQGLIDEGSQPKKVEDKKVFASVEISSPIVTRKIVIKTSTGVEVEIPL